MFVGQGKMPGKTCSQQENAAGRHQHVRHFKSEFLSKAFINVGDPTTRKITKPGHVCDTRTPNCPQLLTSLKEFVSSSGSVLSILWPSLALTKFSIISPMVGWVSVVMTL